MVSEKYINQLIADIKAAHKSEEDIIHQVDEQVDFEQHISEVEGYLAFDYESAPKFGKVIGLELIQFPNADDLNNDQLERLYAAFLELLYSYRISIECPDALPIERKYAIYLNILDEAIFLSDEGSVQWSPCENEPATCCFSEHCLCLEIHQRIERDEQEALAILDDIIGSCSDLLDQHHCVELKIGKPHKDNFDMMCMYIAGGIDYVPFEVYHWEEKLEIATEILIKLFCRNPELASLLSDIGSFEIHNNLEMLLSLSVVKKEGNVFYVEPYYVEDEQLYKGEAKNYTPDELIDKLESEDNDVE